MEYQIPDVVRLLITENVVVEKWREFFDSLGLSQNLVSLQQGRRNRTITDYDLFTEVLEHWRTKMGRAATLDQLCLKLREINCLNACEKVQEAFKINLAGPSSTQPIDFGFTAVASNFAGRIPELEKLNKMLKEFKPEESIIAKIIGMGGIGKSELAKQFANLHKKDMNRVWLNGESEELLQNSLLQLAKHILNTAYQNLSSPQLFPHIIESISKSNTSPILIVIDNIDIVNEDAKSLVKISKELHLICIITSRHVKVLGVAGQTIDLNVLEDEEACSLVRKSIDDEAEEDIVQLCHLLHNYPLALQQAIAFIKNKKIGGISGQGYRIFKYVQNYENQKSKILSFPLDDLEHEYKKTTFMTWNTSIQAIRKVRAVGGVALELLYFIAYLEADGIPFNFIQKLYQEGSRSVTIEDVEKAVELLKGYSLIKVENHEISIHRLVQEVMRLNCTSSKTQHHLLTKMIKSIDAISKMLKQEDMPHVLSVWAHASKHPQIFTPNEITFGRYLIKKLRAFFQNNELLSTKFNSFRVDIIYKLRDLSLYREMLSFSTSSYQIINELLGENHRDTLEMRRLVADGLFWNGKYTEAHEMYEILSSKQKAICGNEDQLTLWTDFMLSQNLVELERYDEAHSLLLILLKRRKKVNGEKSAETIKTKEVLARVLTELGKYVEGEEMYKEVLEWEKSQLGEEETLVTIHNLGHNLYSQGKYGEAKSIFQQLLQVNVRVLRENHSSTLATKYWLAWTLHVLGESGEGLKMLHQVLLPQEKLLGPQHPNTLQTREKIQIINSILSPPE